MAKKKKPSKLKRLVGVFNPRSLKGGIMLFALIFALGGGTYFVYKSFASSVHQYVWNSPGIQHNAGNARIVKTLFDYNKNILTGEKQVWEVNETVRSGDAMWYGPKTTVYGTSSSRSFRACWYYIPPAVNTARMTFDVTYNTDSRAIVQPFSLTISPKALLLGKYFQLDKPLCRDFSLGVGTYPQFQIRVKAVSVGPYVAGKVGGVTTNINTFKMYKTTYQAL